MHVTAYKLDKRKEVNFICPSNGNFTAFLESDSEQHHIYYFQNSSLFGVCTCLDIREELGVSGRVVTHSDVEELEGSIQGENSETISGTRTAKKSESVVHSSPKPSTVSSKQEVSKAIPAPEAVEDFDDGDNDNADGEDDGDGDEDEDDSASYVSSDNGKDK